MRMEHILHKNLTHRGAAVVAPADTTIRSQTFFFNVGGTEQHRVVSNILGSFTTKLQECRKTSTHRKKIFLLPLSHSDESGDNLPSLFKKGKEGLDPARASDLFLSFFSIVVCKYMEEISIGSLFPMVVISFFSCSSSPQVDMWQCLKISPQEYIILHDLQSWAMVEFARGFLLHYPIALCVIRTDA